MTTLCLHSNFQRLVFSACQEISGTELHTHTMTTVCLWGSAHQGINMNKWTQILLHASTHKHMLCSHTHTPAQTGTHTQTHALLTYTHTSTDRHTHQHRQTHTPAQTGTHTHTNTYIHKPFETFPLSHICPSLEQGQTKVKDRRTALEQTEPKQTSKYTTYATPQPHPLYTYIYYT